MDETALKPTKEDDGKEDMAEETQEGCLSRSISLFLRTFKFVKAETACRKDFFDKLWPIMGMIGHSHDCHFSASAILQTDAAAKRRHSEAHRYR